MAQLAEFLKEHAVDDLVDLNVQKQAAESFNLTLAEVEGEILGLGLLPRRYARNRSTIKHADQLKLFRSTVAVIGCGGLGGYIVEELARLGIGTIMVVDPDEFEEHNLNRQLFARQSNLGQPKVYAASRRVSDVNPAATVIPCKERLTIDNGHTLLEKATLAVDALDSIADRLALADVCESLGIPLIHGSVAGFYGQVLTQFPGERTLQKLFAGYGPDKGMESELGNPAFTPAVVASIEAAEAVKVLLGLKTTLRGRLMSVNLLDMEIVSITITD